MLERAELALKIACVVLVAVLLYEAMHWVRRLDPLQGVKVPEVPTLAGGTNATATNVTSAATGATNTTSGKPSGTNTVTDQKSGTASTNRVVAQTNATSTGTNVIATQNTPDTNAVAMSRGASNLMAGTRSGERMANIVSRSATNLPGTNLDARVSGGGTNTNVLVVAKGPGSDTNAAAIAAAAAARRGSSPSARLAGRGAGRGPELSPEAKKRVDWIVRSETLAPIVRPQPMGLLGIAGNRAFIRAPNGQTDMVKEGDSLGGVKLLKIGVNRVLVEEEGQPKELMIYEGYGGDSLLPKPTAKTNETSAPTPSSTAALSPAVAK